MMRGCYTVIVAFHPSGFNAAGSSLMNILRGGSERAVSAAFQYRGRRW